MHFVSFLFQFDLYKKGITILEEILGIVHKELNIRMTLREMTASKKYKKNRKIIKKFMSCARMMVIVLYSLGCGYKREGKIEKFVESLQFSNYVAELLLSKSDNLRISINKFCNQELIKAVFFL